MAVPRGWVPEKFLGTNIIHTRLGLYSGVFISNTGFVFPVPNFDFSVFLMLKTVDFSTVMLYNRVRKEGTRWLVLQKMDIIGTENCLS